MSEPLSDRKLEWEAELRFLLREESRVQERIRELKEILRTFFRGDR